MLKLKVANYNAHVQEEELRLASKIVLVEGGITTTAKSNWPISPEVLSSSPASRIVILIIAATCICNIVGNNWTDSHLTFEAKHGFKL